MSFRRGSALEVKEPLEAIPPPGRGGESEDVAGLHFPHDPIKRNRWGVVALIHDHLPVVGHEIADAFAPRQALDHGHIDAARGLSLPASDLADVPGPKPQKGLEARPPLVQQWLAMDEDEGVHTPRGDHPGPQHGFSRARRGDEDAQVVRFQIRGGAHLGLSELAVELELRRLPWVALILYLQATFEIGEQRGRLFPAASGKGEVGGMFLRGADHAGRAVGGETHGLLLVELRVLEGRQALKLGQQPRGQARLFDVESARLHRLHGRGHFAFDACSLRLPGGWTFPWGLFELVFQRLEGHAQHPPLARGLVRQRLHFHGDHAAQGGQVFPLIWEGDESLIQEEGVPLLPGAVLQRKGDEVAEAPLGHRVLVREEPVVGLHAQLRAPVHGVRQKQAAELPGRGRWHRRGKEDPYVPPFPGTGALQRGGHVMASAGVQEGPGRLGLPLGQFLFQRADRLPHGLGPSLQADQLGFEFLDVPSELWLSSVGAVRHSLPPSDRALAALIHGRPTLEDPRS